MPEPAGIPPFALDAWPFVTAGVALLLVGLCAWVFVNIWLAHAIHRPARMVGGRAWARLGRTSPDDLGLAFEEEVYEVPADPRRPGEAQIDLTAWWLPRPGGRAGRTCVLLHGYGDSRAGALAWAGLWHDLGFDLLLPDARGHGHAGGDLTGGGALERDDLHALLDGLGDRHPSETTVIFAVSYSGLAASAVAATRDDLDALVLESPVRDWADAARRYSDLAGLPLDHAAGPRSWLMQRRLGVRFADVGLTRTLPACRCPLLAILPESDPLLGEDGAIQIAAVAASAGGAVWRPAAGHVTGYAEMPGDYESRLRTFLDAALPAATTRDQGISLAAQ